MKFIKYFMLKKYFTEIKIKKKTQKNTKKTQKKHKKKSLRN